MRVWNPLRERLIADGRLVPVDHQLDARDRRVEDLVAGEPFLALDLAGRRAALVPMSGSDAREWARTHEEVRATRRRASATP